MNFLRTLSLYTCFVFTAVFGLMPAAGNASEVGEAGGLIPMQGGLAAHSVPADSLPETQPGADADRGNDDHQAQVFEVTGEVTVLKKGAENWQPAVKDMVLEEGDKIVTGASSHVDIAYDHFFLNIVRIQEKTKGEFRSIEPTQLFLEDGTVFSALDGLAGKTYQVSTPTAVAGVRGTTFDVSYESATGNLETHVFPDNSAHLGEIFLTSEDGQETKLVEGQGFSEGVVGEIPQEKIENAKQFIEAVDNQFSNMREQGFVTLDTASDAKPENEPVEDRLTDRSDDDKKIGGGPNDGGDTGGGGLKRGGDSTFSGNLKMDGNVDALVDDAMTPPSVSVTENIGDAGTVGERGDRKPTAGLEQAGSGNKTQADYDKAVEFLGVGGANSGTQKGREINLGNFFDSKGNIEFVGGSSGRGNETVVTGGGNNQGLTDSFKERSGADSHGSSGFQQPPQQQQPGFDPSQFFQPGGSSSSGGGSTVNPNPIQQEIVRDQVIISGSGPNPNPNQPPSETDPNKQTDGGCVSNCLGGGGI